MLLKCRITMDGLAPYETVVEIDTMNGAEEVAVHQNSIKGNAIEIGSTLATKEEMTLVELPRETASGKWRVWVPTTSILQTA